MLYGNAERSLGDTSRFWLSKYVPFKLTYLPLSCSTLKLMNETLHHRWSFRRRAILMGFNLREGAQGWRSKRKGRARVLKIPRAPSGMHLVGCGDGKYQTAVENTRQLAFNQQVGWSRGDVVEREKNCLSTPTPHLFSGRTKTANFINKKDPHLKHPK